MIRVNFDPSTAQQPYAAGGGSSSSRATATEVDTIVSNREKMLGFEQTTAHVLDFEN